MLSEQHIQEDVRRSGTGVSNSIAFEAPKKFNQISEASHDAKSEESGHTGQRPGKGDYDT